jgi:NTP pyrophosphatase (non-canonical NTP hydrolase)
MLHKEHYIDHLYTVLQEECAELIVAISKRKRFGETSFDPVDVNKVTQQEKINLEINDVFALIGMLDSQGETVHEDTAKQHTKMYKVNGYYLDTLAKDNLL